MRNFVPQCVPKFLHQRVKSYLAPRQDSMHGKIEVIMLILNTNQFPRKQTKFICTNFTNSSKTRNWSLSTKNIWLYNTTVVRKSNFEKHVDDGKHIYMLVEPATYFYYLPVRLLPYHFYPGDSSECYISRGCSWYLYTV